MRRRGRGFWLGLAATGVAVVLRPGTSGNKLVRRQLERARRGLRDLDGRLQGASYRLAGRRPDPRVVDNVLADRVRSELGGLEHRLDLPRVHVMVERHIVLLHGEVGSDADAEQIERAAATVSGVAGVESYLHSGLTDADTRPSAGRAVVRPSSGLVRLRAAAEANGVATGAVDAVLRGVLGTFADRLPEAQRAHLGSHLPADVRLLFTPPRRVSRAAAPRTVQDLVARIARAVSDLPLANAEEVVEAVLKELRSIVPEEAGDVAAVLPLELRALWLGTGRE